MPAANVAQSAAADAKGVLRAISGQVNVIRMRNSLAAAVRTPMPCIP